ncbi:MAG: acetyl-CoA hydrolase [Acidimicrobiia bacterium]|nr:acetyl-CoA hydrolase [Acidimicrobiia bacterium]
MALIPDGARVYITGLMGTPTALVAGLAAHHHRWRRLTTVADYLFAELATFESPPGVAPDRWPFHHETVQPSPATAKLDPGRLSIIPAPSSAFYRLFRPGGPLEVDVALVQVSPPGPDGTFSLGVAGGATPEVVCSADLVIAEVNLRMPHLPGPVAFARDRFDVLVETDHPPLYLPGAEATMIGARADPDSVAGRIAGHLVNEIPERATIEYGIGAIPDAVVAALGQHRGLGLHSGLIGEAAMSLIDRGAMDGSHKTVDRGLHVASAVVGGPETLKWVRGRDDVVIVASNYSHGVPALARQDRFVAINSAVEVSLDGSVNAEQVGGRVVSGPGGQPDFTAGAAQSTGGMAIVALPSTARRGTRSRIVAKLGPGVPTTVPRYLADRFVTEHGAARVGGATMADRRTLLAAIADEMFLRELLE